jgi:hypothetical protein
MRDRMRLELLPTKSLVTDDEFSIEAIEDFRHASVKLPRDVRKI